MGWTQQRRVIVMRRERRLDLIVEAKRSGRRISKNHGQTELCFIDAGPAQQTLEHYVDHLAHALKICGEDHVGIGSDAILTTFDTSAESMAAWNKDIAARKAAGVGAPGEGRPPYVVGLNRPDRSEVIARALLKRGYPARVAEKVLGANFARVFAQTWPA